MFLVVQESSPSSSLSSSRVFNFLCGSVCVAHLVSQTATDYPSCLGTLVWCINAGNAGNACNAVFSEELVFVFHPQHEEECSTYEFGFNSMAECAGHVGQCFHKPCF